MSFFVKPGPRKSRDLKRILNLPQRDAKEIGEQIADGLTEMLKTSNGTMTLRPLQAIALAEAHDFQGAVVLLAVGQGKTLVSYLLPTVLEASRPLLIVPGKLLDKTQKEFRQLEEHFQKPENLRIVSYEKISTDPDLLDTVKPDLIVADESHKLKNKKAACTKRVWKYWKDNEPMFIPMSGTLTKRSFFDWWHLQLMALPSELCVLPFDWKEAELWSNALDEKTRNRAGLGALKVFGDTVQKAREGYGNLLKRVPAVIASDSSEVGASLRIQIERYRDNATQKALKAMQETWTLPDGTEFSEAVDLWRHSRELAQGFYYRWVEEPPPEWRDARRDFNRRIREAVHYSKKWTAPAQAVEGLRADPIVERWFRIKDTFEPVTEAVWLTQDLLDWCSIFSGAESMLVWFEHKAVGEKLKELGMSVFASQGREIETGQSIIDYKGESAAVSVAALGEGFNLQRWSKNLILSHPPTGTAWEQTLGRTHRPGQESDTVEVEVVIAADVQMKDFEQAQADAEYIGATTGQKQKLSYADII